MDTSRFPERESGAIGIAELVITAPEPHAAALAYAARCRSTLGVLVQLFADAKRHVIVASLFMQAATISGTGALALAMRGALRRGVVLHILSTQQNLEDAQLRDITVTHGANVRLFVPSFPQFEPSQLGSHAKFCIRDGEQAYVGSATLTGPGLHQHFEMGLLVSGPVATAMQKFWDFAIKPRPVWKIQFLEPGSLACRAKRRSDLDEEKLHVSNWTGFNHNLFQQVIVK